MSIAIGDDHLLLAEAVARFAAAQCTPSVARAAVDGTSTDDEGPTSETASTGTAASTDDREPLPPFWDELARLGWLAPDSARGAGVSELVVVLEALGRALAPGPALATSWTLAVLRASGAGTASSGGGTDPVADWTTRLTEGTAVGAVARGGDVTAGGLSGTTGLDGGTGPVLCAAAADVVVVSALDEAGGERWFLVERSAAEVVPLESLDGTQALASIQMHDTPAVELPTVSRHLVEAIGTTLAAAVAVGGAQWCVQTAAAHAAERRQFGRPIGQFQAVKHRCADMLVRLEQARAVTWDAAAELDHGDPRDPGDALAVSACGALALDAFVEVAKDCIQVLGGIGFTWEHDAHLYLRRATALRQVVGGPAPWRGHLARIVLDGARRRLSVDLPAEAEDLRAGIARLVDDIAARPKDQRRVPLAEAGLITPHWPAPWGRDAGSMEQLVIEEELRRARVRPPHLQVGAWAAPTIVTHGTPEQQHRWVGPTLRGEISWCQLFSEPEAGSDLASLTTTATRIDGGWSLRGQKVWTSMAAEADWGICLARTDPNAPKHLGITYFVIDMDSPGLDIRPLREMTGMEMFNEVFLDDVVVPDDAVVGEVNGGWALARTTLANERVSMGSGSSFGGGIEALVQMAGERLADGRIPDDPLVLDRLGAAVAEAHSVAVLGLRSTLRSLTGADPGPEASVRKLLGAEHDQRTQELGLTLLGAEGATTVDDAARWTFGFLANRCLTIAGGTSEIQRNVIAERLLGLPRDPEPAGRGSESVRQ